MQRRSPGFTLIEMLVVMAIAVVLTTIAIPSFDAMITSARMAGEINALQSTLNLARSEASKRGQSVAVCPVSGTDCATSTDWTSGWQVLQPDTATQVRIAPGIGHGVTLTSSLSSYPVFTAMGYTFYSGTLSLHDRHHTPSLTRCIVFDAGSWTAKQGAACP